MSDGLFLDPGKSLQANSGAWYQIVQQLGAGGNAVTYLVVATDGGGRGLLFALKIFRRLSKPERRDSFLREVAFLKERSHPAIMRVFDDGLFRYRVDGQAREFPFVVAEYLPHTLYQVMRARTASLVERTSYAVQLLSALIFLDRLAPPVVHRDIKPQNIFVKGRSCVLGDFGLLKALDGGEADDRDVLKESIGPGMPFFYRTPDLVAYARNEGPLTTKTDVFQLGLVLAELFTGWNPMKRPTGEAGMLGPVEVEPLRDCPGELGASIANLIRRMLVLKPQERMKAAEMMDGWMGLFRELCERTHALEGKVF